MMRIDTQDTETTTGENMKIQMDRRQGKAIALGLLVLALVVGACGGGGDDEPTPQAAADKADSTETAEAEATEQKKTEEAEEAAEVACRMEHILTRDVENRLSDFLGVKKGTDSDLFCHQVNVEPESEPEFVPLSSFKEGKTGKVRIVMEKSDLTSTLEKVASDLSASYE